MLLCTLCSVPEASSSPNQVWPASADYVVSNSEAVLLFLTGTTKAEIEFVSGGRLEDLGAENKIVSLPVRTDVFKYSFFPRTITDWNSLPLAVRLLQSTQSFHGVLQNSASANRC